MDDDREHRIRERAHDLWQAEGRPDGRHERHWLAAEEEFDRQHAASEARPERTTRMEPHSEVAEDAAAAEDPPALED